MANLICVDARLWSATGIGTFLKNLLPFFLEEKGFSLVLLCYSLDQKELNEKGFSHLIVVKSPLYSFKEQLEIPLKVPPCSLFWSPHFNVPVLPLRAKRRLVTIHDTYHLTFANQFSLVGRMYAYFLYRFAARQSDFITTVSHFSAGEISRHCAPFSSPLKVISPGVCSRFVPCTNETRKKEVQNRYALPFNFLLVVGNFKTHKNEKMLLEAFQTLGFHIHLVLVGKKQTVPIERVQSIPSVSDEDLPIVYSLASALVFPSLYEGFGLPPLEAMACGCPAIVARSASIPEACGEAVEYVDPHSVDSIRKGIRHVIEFKERKEELIAKGFLHVKQIRWENCAAQYVSIFRQLCNL